MIDRFARAVLAPIACLTLAMPGLAQAADLPAYKQPARQTGVTYDQAIHCQAVYVVVGGQFDEGSEDQQLYIAFYDAWYDFNEKVYPLDFAQRHEGDVDAAAQRIFDSWNAMSTDDLDAAVDNVLGTCEALEDAELL